MALPESFMEKVTVAPSGCWEWTGSKYGNGYGRYRPDGRPSIDKGKDSRVLAHRFAYESTHGPIANVINHRCENKGCVNPGHLEDVTQQENVQYSLSDTCVRGHDLTAGSPNVWIDEKRNKRKCRACNRENKKAEYESDPQKLIDRAKAYYADNRASVLAQKRGYYLKNRDTILARRREAYLKKASKS